MSDESQGLEVRTVAPALYQLLNAVKSKDSTLADAWVAVLDASWNSLEFARRHAEVVLLWTDLPNEIATLEPESLRKRLERYMATWWTAIVQPNATWESKTADSLVSQSDLDMLAMVGDLADSRRGSVDRTSAASSLKRLREECEAWLLLVSGNDEIIDETFRRTLLAQINHLIWLIDNAGIFGVSQVVGRGDEITGTLIRATGRQGTIKNTPRFRDRLNSFITALTLVANLIHSSQVVFDAADHALSGTERIIKEITGGNQGDVKPGHGNATPQPRRGGATE